MALPNSYASNQKYFADVMDFLEKYAWIYQHSNTAFLKANVFESFPSDFKAYFTTITNEELNEFPLLQQTPVKCDTMNLVNEFRSELKSLIPVQAFAEADRNLNANIKLNFRKMNIKKQHEITSLAQIINNLCQTDIDLLIDFGAGLGYLSEMIFKLSNNKFLMLGLEAEATRVEAARKRQQQFMPKTLKKCNYKQQFITESSNLFIKENCTELAELNGLCSANIAIIGLHACADLTITAMKLFFEMGPNIKKLIIMPCCYHKLELNSATSKTFRNFPLSQTFKNVVEKFDESAEFLNRPFLRLACQQTLARWRTMNTEAHKKHGLDMLRRGVAEAIISEDVEYVVKQKTVKAENLLAEDIESFQEFTQFYEIRSKASNKVLPWTTAHETKFKLLKEKLGVEGYKLAEGLTCLQTAMQKLCENIVLYDRLCYMEEYASANNLKVNVRYEKLLDEKLSPRCYVLIAEKL